MVTKRLTVSEWIRSEVAEGRLPRIRGAEENSNTDSSTENKDENSSEVNPLDALQLTDEQRKAFGKIISDERKKAKASGKSEAEQEAANAAEQARIAKETEEAKEAGKFEEVEKSLNSTIESQKATIKERDETITSLNERLTALNSAFDTAFKADWEALPEEVRDLFSGDAEDALAKMEFLNRDSVKKLAGNTGKRSSDGTIPRNPLNNNNSGFDEKAARASQSTLYRNA